MRPLLVKVTVGDDAPERSLQGLTVAAVAAASGATVSVWLAGQAVHLAAGADVVLPASPPASELLTTLLGLGRVTACTQCLVRRGLTERDLLPGVAVGGAAGFVAEALEGDVQALVY